MTSLEAAQSFYQRRWVPIPLCWPNPDGSCACGRTDRYGKPNLHESRDVGKAPLISNWQEAHPTEKTIRSWFGKRWPRANVGIVLASSGLLAVDIDSPDAYTEASERGLPSTVTRISNNPAFLYARPSNCPITNSTLQGRSGKIDILANAQVVAFGVHRTGKVVYLEGDGLAEAPQWAIEMLNKSNGHRVDVKLPLSLPVVDIDRLEVGDRIKALIISGEGDRYPSRSEAEFAVIEALIRAGYDDPTIAGVVLNNAIGEKAREKGIKWLETELARARGKMSKMASTAPCPGAWPSSSSDGSLGQDESLPDDEPYHLECLADVEAEQVHWLWPGRIPLGKITILDGDPGLGKSVLSLDLAARLSTGQVMPDGTTSALGGPASVLLLSAEDDPADTIRPRLDGAGADCARICIFQYVIAHGPVNGNTRQEDRHLPCIPDDLPRIEKAIVDVGARLVVIDPLMAFLSGKVNGHNDQEVRRALAPLAAMGERTDAAILVIRHLNKLVGTSAIYRGGGSIGIIGAARSGLLVGKDPNDPEGLRRVLASTKSNLAVQPSSLIYHLEAVPNGTVRVSWDGTTGLTANSLLSQPSEGEDGDARAEAKAFLLAILGEGPKASNEVLREAKELGITERTLRRAKSSLGVKADKDGFSGGWVWSLRETETTSGTAEDGQDDPKAAT